MEIQNTKNKEILKMKHVICTVLCLMLTLSFTACGQTTRAATPVATKALWKGRRAV